MLYWLYLQSEFFLILWDTVKSSFLLLSKKVFIFFNSNAYYVSGIFRVFWGIFYLWKMVWHGYGLQRAFAVWCYPTEQREETNDFKIFWENKSHWPIDVSYQIWSYSKTKCTLNSIKIFFTILKHLPMVRYKKNTQYIHKKVFYWMLQCV